MGIADIGRNPEEAPYNWGQNASIILRRGSAAQLYVNRVEQQWCRRLLKTLGHPVSLRPQGELVPNVLRLAAQVLDDDPSIVGAGMVDQFVARAFIRELTPTRAAAALGLEPEVVERLRSVDDELGPLWGADQLDMLEDVFGTGVRLCIARVVD